jgi:hypothetical protein
MIERTSCWLCVWRCDKTLLCHLPPTLLQGPCCSSRMPCSQLAGSLHWGRAKGQIDLV